MTRSTGKRQFHFKNTIPKDPSLTPFGTWPLPNRSFHHAFYHWLKSGGYGHSTLNVYSVAARLALSYLNKLYSRIDLDADLERVRGYIEGHYPSVSTRMEYEKGLRKLAEYLRLRQNKTARPPIIHWEHYLNGLPDWLCEHIRIFIAHKQQGWRPADRHSSAIGTLSTLSQILHGMVSTAQLQCAADITPQVWFDYLDTQLVAGRHPNTINNHLFRLRAFLHFLDDAGIPICQRMLIVEPLKTGPRLPRDASIDSLRRLLSEIENESKARHASRRRMGLLDQAWVHLMLFSGLRSCEVRRLRMSDINWENHRIRIEQSKGLKDRLVFMNSATVQALQTWLVERGQAEYLSDRVFLYRHQSLHRSYCQVRLRTYGRRGGFQITPHQLRHSCATLLLNAGAPVISVQALLGHKKVDTTLGYARLYDGTIAADYYRAIGQIENLLKVPETGQISISTPAQLVALVDSLAGGTLNQAQRETLHTLREGILTLATKELIKV
jgi:site-specific recombinase XerD